MGGLQSLLSPLQALTSSPSAHSVGHWLLALIFAWSGSTKLRRPGRTALALIDFGLVRTYRRELGVVVGASELLLGVVLALAAMSAGSRLTPLASACAAAVLSFFVLIIARSLRRGDAFPCFCFGGETSELSRSSLIRTALLALIAVVLIFSDARADDSARETALEGLVALALLGTAALTGQVLPLVRANGDPFGVKTEVVRVKRLADR